MCRKMKAAVMIAVMIAVIAICRDAGKRLKESIMEAAETGAEASGSCLIVLDPGHGGIDAGKIGINNAEEKQINLEISLKIKKLLKDGGITVIMTRTEDNRLADTQKQDLMERVKIMNEEQPALVVSIHQNSYQESGVRGPQVFYYTDSAEAETAAEILQSELNKMDPSYTRKEKANSSYYILKQTEVPVVIVECGFLSNAEEAEKLISEEYQNTVANAVVSGIEKYIN